MKHNLPLSSGETRGHRKTTHEASYPCKYKLMKSLLRPQGPFVSATQASLRVAWREDRRSQHCSFAQIVESLGSQEEASLTKGFSDRFEWSPWPVLLLTVSFLACLYWTASTLTVKTGRGVWKMPFIFIFTKLYILPVWVKHVSVCFASFLD